MQSVNDRYVASARTPPGRALRRWAVARGPYVRAVDEALAHARARAAGLPEPSFPRLYARGALPLIHRHTGDRRLLDEESGVSIRTTASEVRGELPNSHFL
ncbi:hypothetical protein ACIG3E_33050 [Streptomyces sp. NPDC053474]|uniref:hypothetical protein n=1 Tax=Streptomyces sp. NPDC053474 TaxID=3365704 RepID=UPI0037D4898C